ncbi:MAG: hypothetical protein H6861_01480 [Rhodospirillales bacterium]|nr:hypothetical protein [Rhodospirillales bacterium]
MEDIKQKFFFDVNIFDEYGNIESELIEDEEPPVPVFSEAELEAAKKAAFKNGHEQATVEAKNSRAQNLASVLEALSKDMATLFAQEAARAKLYEHEAVALTRHVFEKLFPYYAKEAGFGELTGALEHVLETHARQSLILMRVAPDMVEGVETFLQRLQSQNPEFRFTVRGDDTLQGHACALSWEDGGALHNNDAMAAEILGILREGTQDGLAGENANRHDGGDSVRDEVALLAASYDAEVPDKNSEHPDLKEKPDE